MKYAIYALLLSAAVTMVSGPVLIPLLHKLKFGQSERKLGPETHLKKAGTPTMGGITFILGIVAATMIFAYSASELVMPALLMTVAFALVGFMDDFLKVKKHNTDGLRAYQKIIAQFLIAQKTIRRHCGIQILAAQRNVLCFLEIKTVTIAYFYFGLFSEQHGGFIAVIVHNLYFTVPS